ncbi:MAG: hypothetical protein LBC18_04745, partial [Opitutaceae bacterium]|nr:hypothetical protein [Opitutaceae bacterium]
PPPPRISHHTCEYEVTLLIFIAFGAAGLCPAQTTPPPPAAPAPVDADDEVVEPSALTVLSRADDGHGASMSATGSRVAGKNRLAAAARAFREASLSAAFPPSPFPRRSSSSPVFPPTHTSPIFP